MRPSANSPLKKERPELFNLFLYLILATIFILSFVILAGRSHLIDFGWMLALLAALGLISLFSLLEKYFQLNKKNFFILSGFIFLMVLYNLLLAGHSYWGRVYDNEDNLAILNYSFQIKKLNLSEKDVIALGTGATAGALALNYLTDKSVIVFQEQTVKNLLAEGGLASAFKKFGVTYIVGYPDDLSKKILAQAKVININSSQNNISGQNIISENNSLKSWLMNLIK